MRPAKLMNPFQMPGVNMFRKIVEQQKNLHFLNKNISMYVKSIFYVTIERCVVLQTLNVTNIYPRFSTETYAISKQSLQNSRNLLFR